MRESLEKLPIPLAAALITWFVSNYFGFLPVGSELDARGFGIVSGFAGAWLGVSGRVPNYMRWLEENAIPLPVVGFLLFAAAMISYLLMWGYIVSPPYWLILIEATLYGLAMLFFFWCVTGAGGKLIS